MASLAELMSVYYRYHTKTITLVTHFIGVPCIIFALQILFCQVHVFTLSLAWIAACALLVYYLFLDISLALATAAFLLPMTYLAGLIPHGRFALGVFLLTFVGGWAAQLVGHYYEGKRPALTDNFFQVFVAPIFLVAELFFILGYRQNLRQQVAELAKRRDE